VVLLAAIWRFPPQPAPMRVNFITLPPEASILVDGETLRQPNGTPYTTPCTVDGLPPGRHRVALQDPEGLELDVGEVDFSTTREVFVSGESSPKAETSGSRRLLRKPAIPGATRRRRLEPIVTTGGRSGSLWTWHDHDEPQAAAWCAACSTVLTRACRSSTRPAITARQRPLTPSSHSYRVRVLNSPRYSSRTGRRAAKWAGTNLYLSPPFTSVTGCVGTTLLDLR
jgi:hypothetical protein